MRLPSSKCDVSIEMKGERTAQVQEVLMSNDIRFTIEQLMYLERIFPEITQSGSGYGDLQYQAGQRNVLNHIRNKANARLQYVPVQGDVLPRR